ncbi:MAG TPA: c-type cytochrome biogenesis protein CcmI [Xanthobacteraceae bacterium]|nr:c-type cytochrome biogenesis protein CcmI [Xanthobacteraceae bacterium]
MLWGLLALMTLAALGAVAWPLRRRLGGVPSAAASDVAVYRDQLAEIARDQASGLIAAPEAQAARTEVSRRLLAAADRVAPPQPAGDGVPARRRRLAAAGALVVLPVGAVALYLAIGSPGLEGSSLDARIAAAHGDRSVEALFAQVEAHLEQHPEDGRGWEVIAPIYMDLGRYDDAVKARGNALRLLGATAEREAFYGEALTAAANGVVTAEAKAAFDRAIDRDRRDPTARFYEGLAAEQDGSREDAARIWRALLADAPEGAQWASFVRQALARVEAPGAAAPPGNEAAQDTAGSDQMIRTMVERLAARLKQDGSDVDGWVRLARSYKVLGEEQRMNAAIADARRALANDPAALKRLDDGLASLAAPPEPAPAAPAAKAAPPAAGAGSQDQMIHGMVERLAARLEQDGSDVDGWVRLARSYKVLGEEQRMNGAIADARRALANDPAALKRLDDGLASLDAPPAAAALAPDAKAAAPAAGAGSPDQMVLSMVERLAARLKQDGSDADGWIMLVRSYKVLGDAERMKGAIADARRALAGEPDKLNRFEQGVKSLGIEG